MLLFLCRCSKDADTFAGTSRLVPLSFRSRSARDESHSQKTSHSRFVLCHHAWPGLAAIARAGYEPSFAADNNALFIQNNDINECLSNVSFYNPYAARSF
jgi:hypothetical protein